VPQPTTLPRAPIFRYYEAKFNLICRIAQVTPRACVMCYKKDAFRSIEGETKERKYASHSRKYIFQTYSAYFVSLDAHLWQAQIYFWKTICAKNTLSRSDIINRYIKKITSWYGGTSHSDFNFRSPSLSWCTTEGLWYIFLCCVKSPSYTNYFPYDKQTLMRSLHYSKGQWLPLRKLLFQLSFL
jgi:hypothetical protein